MAGLLTLSRIAVGSYGPGAFGPTGKFNKLRRRREEIVRSGDPVAAKLEDGDSLAAGVPRSAVRYEDNVCVGSRKDRNRRVLVAR
jgi:hypothetical protein